MRMQVIIYNGTAENCEISEPAPEKLSFDGKICYNTLERRASVTQSLQIHQKHEAVFATSSGRQTSKERKCLAVKQRCCQEYIV